MSKTTYPEVQKSQLGRINTFLTFLPMIFITARQDKLSDLNRLILLGSAILIFGSVGYAYQENQKFLKESGLI